MANVGGRQLTLGACGLTKFAETTDGRKVQLHIPKYVQGPVGRACRYAGRGCRYADRMALFFRILVWNLRTLHFLAYRQCQRQNGRAGQSWVKFLILTLFSRTLAWSLRRDPPPGFPGGG